MNIENENPKNLTPGLIVVHPAHGVGLTALDAYAAHHGHCVLIVMFVDSNGEATDTADLSEWTRLLSAPW